MVKLTSQLFPPRIPMGHHIVLSLPWSTWILYSLRWWCHHLSMCHGSRVATTNREGTLNQVWQHTSNVSDPELEPLANELLDAAEKRYGFSAYPEQGKLLIFFTTGDDGKVDPLSWHGGARVCSSGDFGGKWMLQIFKTFPPNILSDKDLLPDFQPVVVDLQSLFAITFVTDITRKKCASAKSN